MEEIGFLEIFEVPFDDTDDQKWRGCLEEKFTGSGVRKRSKPPKSNA